MADDGRVVRDLDRMMKGDSDRCEYYPIGVNITIGWDGWAGRATLHDTDAARTHSGAHEGVKSRVVESQFSA